MKSIEWWLAFRFLRAKRQEGFISVIAGFSFLGLMLGVATLIVVMAVMNGFRAELTKRILGINAHITLSAGVNGVTNYDDLLRRIEALPNINHAAPTVQGQVLATYGDAHAGVLVQGMRADDLANRPIVANNLVAGRLDAMNDSPYNVVVGIRLAQSLGVLPGDVIQLISPQTNSTIIGAMPRIKDVTVVGIVEVGMYEYDSSTIFMPLAGAQIYFQKNAPKAVSSIAIMTNDYNNTEAIRHEIKQAISGNYYLTDWKQVNHHYFQSLRVERNVMFLILSLIVAVAAFNIISGLVMMVTDKSKEIAILRTMGMRRISIMRVFIITGFVVGVLGTVLGVLLGVGFAANIEEIRQLLESLTDTELFAAEIYFLSQLPAEVELDNIVKISLMSLSLSFLATLYPAWKAARTSPVEMLGHE